MRYKICFELAEPSTESMNGVHLFFPGGNLTLKYDFHRKGVVLNAGIIFHNVAAFGNVGEPHCQAEVIEAAYDRLIEIENSEKISDLLKNTSYVSPNHHNLKHFMIYFDSDGCYEVIAQSWVALSEIEGGLIKQ